MCEPVPTRPWSQWPRSTRRQHPSVAWACESTWAAQVRVRSILSFSLAVMSLMVTWPSARSVVSREAQSRVEKCSAVWPISKPACCKENRGSWRRACGAAPQCSNHRAQSNARTRRSTQATVRDLRLGSDLRFAKDGCQARKVRLAVLGRRWPY